LSAPGKQWRGVWACSTRRKETSSSSSVGGSCGGKHGETCKAIAPLQLETPSGQLLSQLLKDHPHLLPAAVDQQLDSLIAERDEPPSTTGADPILYRRIAELKAAERRDALEEIIYALVVQKFMDSGISLISSVSQADPVTGKVDTWPKQDHKLVRVHSHEALEMIKNHLALVLGNRLQGTNAIAQISKLRVGQVYAASIMYGYFLRRVDQRFQLEKNMNMLPFGLNKESDDAGQRLSSSESTRADEFEEGYSFPDVTSATMPGSGAPSIPEFNGAVKPCKLRAYVESFDEDTLQRYATMRSKEGVNLIERHSGALFAKPRLHIASASMAAASDDEMIRLSFSGLTSLVLEAVTLGSFLWDVENYVDY
ncbi:hypothetical protein KI387_025180, partial [Taxus chinensis]